MGKRKAPAAEGRAVRRTARGEAGELKDDTESVIESINNKTLMSIMSQNLRRASSEHSKSASIVVFQI